MLTLSREASLSLSHRERERESSRVSNSRYCGRVKSSMAENSVIKMYAFVKMEH